ncbi:MAG: DNA polymerase-3 subunit gamma/tau [Bacteroidia bacterium]|jgi:DNA polymerase-3 subunit gamma/tau
MEHYIVSARKYRPLVWEDVVGQKAITSTLQRAIENDHLAQAFLFCGPRGVGKTTCARILARAINEDDQTDSNEDFSFNIFELDAASNNKVEDIRHLTDQVRFAPQKGNYKIYIIDEVHMLSQAAFNAFLKTLEEPPPHAIFILATTEKHKIIPTILSRCQIFDFKRIGINDMVEHLQFVAGKEGVTTEESALHVIAEKADGAMRDALSTFDRLVTFAGDNLTYKDAIANLNILDHDYYFKTTEQILTGDVSGILLTFNDVLANGFNGHDFINGLANHLRNLLVTKDPATQNLLEVSGAVLNRYKEQSASCSVANLLKSLRITNQTDVQYRNSKNQRLLVELALMRLCELHGELSDHIEQPLEKKNTSSLVAEPVVQIEKPQPVPVETPVEEPKQESSPEPVPVAVQPKVEATEPQKVEVPAEELAADVTTVPKEPTSPTPAHVEETEAPKPKVKLERKRSRAGGLINIANLGSTSKEEEGGSENATPDLSESFTEEELLKVWKDQALELFSDRPSLRSTLDKSRPTVNDGNVIVVKLENSAQVETLREHGTEMLENIRKALNNYTITLETEVDKVISSKQAFTSKDKYEKLKEENPDLEKLKDQLGLDLDY